MSHAYTATLTQRGRDGGRDWWLWTLAETGAGTADEWQIPVGIKCGTIVSYKVTLGTGAGATVNPILGNATGFTASSQGHLATNATTAAFISDQTSLIIPYLPTRVLFGQSRCDAGADNVVSTEILIVEGILD